MISGSHQNFIYLERNGAVLLDKGAVADSAEGGNDVVLDAATVYQFATETPVDDISFILEAKRLNLAAAELGLKGGYGHSLGAALNRGTVLSETRRLSI